MDLNGGTRAPPILPIGTHTRECPHDPWQLTNDFHEIATLPTDLQHPPMGSHMFDRERLSQDVCPLKVPDRS